MPFVDDIGADFGGLSACLAAHWHAMLPSQSYIAHSCVNSPYAAHAVF